MITKIKNPFFDLFDTVFELEKGINIPKSNVQKNNNGYELLLSIPGLSKEDLKIIIKEGVLKISFEREGGSIFDENFTKSYTLPDDVNENQIEGKVENGVLKLILPISKKKSIEKFISIN